jgi:hypothetical protein
LTWLGFVRKFRPKLINKIGFRPWPSTEAAASCARDNFAELFFDDNDKEQV